MWNELLIFSKWLETTHLSHLMAGGWKWGWPTCETLHFIGLSMLLGCIGVVDLRMLGVGKSMPGAPVHKLVPWAVAGFLINAVTGVLFFIGAPHQYIKNVAFLFKMLFLVVAGINILLFYATGMLKTSGGHWPRRGRTHRREGDLGSLHLFLAHGPLLGPHAARSSATRSKPAATMQRFKFLLPGMVLVVGLGVVSLPQLPSEP